MSSNQAGKSEATIEREKVLEERYILDFERSLATRGRRNALLANWIAARTGRNDVAALTEEVLRLGHAEASDDGLCDRLCSDLRGWGIALDAAELRSTAHALLFAAAEQLAEEDEAGASA